VGDVDGLVAHQAFVADLVMKDGAKVTAIEGLATDRALHALQQAFGQGYVSCLKRGLYITASSYTSTPAFLAECGAARLAGGMGAFMSRHGGSLCATPDQWRRSMPPKTPKSKASEGKPNALQKPLQPSEELAAVVGTSPLPRGEVVSKIWEYIRSHNLQNPENRREILADGKLTKVFGKDKVTMFEMNKHLTRHLK
jgi:hypothetical protein